MAKKLDPAIADVLKQYGFGAEACWDCHGTWVVYHKALEQIGAKAGIVFSPPQVIEANGTAKTAAICVVGTLGTRSEWSIGEAAPGNNKNAYPFAMAEKRAKDRVILKLIGLHGLVYSEEEADDFKNERPSAPPPKQEPPADLDAERKQAALVKRLNEKCDEIVKAIESAVDGKALDAVWNYHSNPTNGAKQGAIPFFEEQENKAWINQINAAYNKQAESFNQLAAG